jgi:hypothetical protein
VTEGARAGGRALTGRPGNVSDRGGERALTERAQRQRGNGRLQGSEEVRAVRSRSDGGGPKGVRTGPSGSEGGPSRCEWHWQVGQGMSGARVRSGIPRSGPFDLNRTEGNQTKGKRMAAGGVAPLHGGEVVGAEASAS